MATFTPWSALLGGALIGLAAAGLWILLGRIAGITGVVGDLVTLPDRGWRLAFVVGLVGVGVVAAHLAPGRVGVAPGSPLELAAVGLVVGVGTAVGNGCTSGHGVCGLGRLSPRSLVATLTFIATGVLAATLMRLHGGW